MNGTNGSTTFIDSSSAARSMTVAGNAQLSTTSPKFGTAAGLFDGTGDNVSHTGTSAYAFGTGDFTVDFWAKRTDTASDQIVFELGTGAGAGCRFNINDGLDRVNIQMGGTTRVFTADALSSAVWYHFAVVRSSGTLMYFRDGTKNATTFAETTNITGTPGMFIGTNTGAGLGYNGRVDEFRVSNVARWTSNFTSPTVEYS